MITSSEKNKIATKQIVILLILFLNTTLISYAQVKKQSVTIPDPIKNLEVLIGKWEGIAKSETGPVVTNKDYTVSYEFTKALKGSAIKMLSTNKASDENKIVESNGIIGYDTASKMIHMFSVSDACETFDLKGNWTNMTTLNFTYEGIRSSKKFSINMWFTIVDQEHIELKTYATIGEDLLITTETKLNKIIAKKTQK